MHYVKSGMKQLPNNIHLSVHKIWWISHVDFWISRSLNYIFANSQQDFSVVSQATPFAERGKVWSCCNYQVVAEERNY